MTNVEKKFKSHDIYFDCEAYLQIINKKCEKHMSVSKKIEKIIDSDVVIPTTTKYDVILEYNYNKEQLKKFLKHYKLKLSGSKKEIITRIFCFLRLSGYAMKIQKIFRGRIQRKYNDLHGPALFKRNICTNNTDFFTMEDLSEISYSQFFSYKDIDDFIYGFDIISLYNLVQKSGKDVKNPYNRMIIPRKTLQSIKTLLRLGKLLKISIEIEIKDVLTEEKSTELRILSLFQNIDSLGHYSNPTWFTSLNRASLMKFIREICDIWNYRAQLSNEIKRTICPPNGDPFVNFNVSSVLTDPNLDNVKKRILLVLEKIVNNGIDRDSKALGAYYVLGALTLVNNEAATNIPWLYQSFSYF